MKYFIFGIVFCFAFLLVFSFCLLKFITPILEKKKYKDSALRLYTLCQELIHS